MVASKEAIMFLILFSHSFLENRSVNSFHFALRFVMVRTFSIGRGPWVGLGGTMLFKDEIGKTFANDFCSQMLK